MNANAAFIVILWQPLGRALAVVGPCDYRTALEWVGLLARRRGWPVMYEVGTPLCRRALAIALADISPALVPPAQ